MRPSAPITMRTASAGRSSRGRKRAEIVGDPLRQHRHDPVGEIDRVAALLRLPVEGGAGAHIGGDVGDGDGDDEAARVVGIVVRRRMDGVVVVLGVRRIDGDEGQVAPILAAFQGGGLRLLGLVQDGLAGTRWGCCGRGSRSG